MGLYREGVQAGNAQSASKLSRTDVGHFWGLLETRPYMRPFGVRLNAPGNSANNKTRSHTPRSSSASTRTTTKACATGWPRGYWSSIDWTR